MGGNIARRPQALGRRNEERNPSKTSRKRGDSRMNPRSFLNYSFTPKNSATKSKVCLSTELGGNPKGSLREDFSH
jgi:hypothetical protein